MNSVLFMDQIEDLYLLSGKEGVVIYFLVEGSDVTQYLMLIMLVIKAWYVTKQCVLPDQNFDGLFSIQNSKRPVSFGSVRERERERDESWLDLGFNIFCFSLKCFALVSLPRKADTFRGF